MSKKKTPKTSSARGHIESNVIRWRLKQKLIRLGPDGKPVSGKLPINTFSGDWLAQHLFNSGGMSPPTSNTPPKPPDNVSHIADHKPKPKPKPQAKSGNEAEAVPDPHRETMDLSFLHDKAMAIDEFRHWSRISKEIGRRCPVVWVKKPDGKLSSPDLELQRQRSIDGHKKPKLKFKSPPSLVHNPVLSGKPVCVYNQRLRKNSKVRGNTILTPSGRPINDFKPKENSVVYTNELPFVKAKAPPSPPATPNRDWRGPAANDAHVAVRRVPDKDTLVFKMNAEVQWFINNVEPQNWPVHVHNFANWRSGGPIPNTGAINKAAADPATRERLISAMYQGLLEDWKMLDSALSMSNQEVSLLNQELASERQANGLYEYDLAMRNGESPDAVREAYIKPKTPDVPDDADVMLSQFNTYQSFVKCDGPEHAFARYVYNDPRLGDVIRDHADMRCRERQRDVEHRNVVRFLRAFAQYAHNIVEADYSDWWNEEFPKYQRTKERAKFTAVHSPSSEACVYAVLSSNARKGINLNPNSIYYSAPNKAHAINSAVAKGLLSKVRPAKYRDCPSKRASYEKWWSQWADYCEVKYHESHALGRAKIAFVKSYNKVVDTLNTPVDYGTRKRQREALARVRKHQAILNEQRERRKEERMKRKADRKLKQQLRKAYSIAH